MSDANKVNLATFEANLSPAAFACFRALFETARGVFAKEGPQAQYHAPLTLLQDANGDVNFDEVVKSIQEILKHKVKVNEGKTMYVYPFFTSICLEDGMVKYGLPREIENSLPQATLTRRS